jgi:hypothetical protein
MRTDVLIFIAWKGEKIVTNVTSLGVDFLREVSIRKVSVLLISLKAYQIDGWMF